MILIYLAREEVVTANTSALQPEPMINPEKLLSVSTEGLNITNTSIVITKITDSGEEYINQYMIIKNLGRYDYK